MPTDLEADDSRQAAALPVRRPVPAARYLMSGVVPHSHHHHRRSFFFSPCEDEGKFSY
jgi:hypothetical protein